MNKHEQYGPLDLDAAEHEAAKLENEQLLHQQEELLIYKILKGAATGSFDEVIHDDGSASYYRIGIDGSVSEKPDLFLDREQRGKYLERITTLIHQVEQGLAGETMKCPECGSLMVEDVQGPGQSQWICPKDMTTVQ